MSLHLLMINVLKIITTTYMIAKYRQVLANALPENTKLYDDISASNMFATSTLVICEIPIPARSPTTSDTSPMISVSMKSIVDTLRFPIPRMRYRPNSLLRLFIRKRLAYMMRNPSTNAMNTLTPAIILLMSCTTCLVSADIRSMAVCVSMALNT